MGATSLACLRASYLSRAFAAQCRCYPVRDRQGGVLLPQRRLPRGYGPRILVVIKADTPWHYTQDGVDLVVKDPTGAHIYDSRDKTSDKFEFIVQKGGVHRFCFTNKSPYHETVDFDVHVGHFSYFDQHAKDEHFGPLFEQIVKLDEALYNIQFEQHWLEAQTDRQAISVQTAWRVGNDAVEAGSNLVPGSVPRPIARIGVAFAAGAVALFLVKSVVSTALFVLAMMGLIYLGFLAMNPKEASGSKLDEAMGSDSSDDPVEEARRIMEKYK